MARIETWLIGDGVEQRRGRSPIVFDPSFDLGQTEPDATNTGCRIPEDQLTTINGNLTWVPAGTPTENGVPVISGYRILGRVSLAIPRVIFRDNQVRGDGEGRPLISCTSDAIVDHLYEFNTLEPLNRHPHYNGMNGGNFTARRNDISGVTDGFNPFGSDVNMKTVRLLGNYVHDLHEMPDPGHDNGVTHNDAAQAFGGLARLEIIGNRLHGGNTTAVLLQQDRGPYGFAQVDDNWLYTIPNEDVFAMSTPRHDFTPSNLSVKRNRVQRVTGGSRIMAKAGSRHPAIYGMLGTPEALPSTWTAGPDCNRWMDNGQPVPISQG